MPSKTLFKWVALAVFVAFAPLTYQTLNDAWEARDKALKEAFFGRVCDAIYRAEGGRHPYGIKSKTKRQHAAARRICLNTVRNNHVRWQAAGRPDDFISFLGDRYAPGHPEWKQNVRSIMKQGE